MQTEKLALRGITVIHFNLGLWKFMRNCICWNLCIIFSHKCLVLPPNLVTATETQWSSYNLLKLYQKLSMFLLQGAHLKSSFPGKTSRFAIKRNKKGADDHHSTRQSLHLHSSSPSSKAKCFYARLSCPSFLPKGGDCLLCFQKQTGMCSSCLRAYRTLQIKQAKNQKPFQI